MHEIYFGPDLPDDIDDRGSDSEPKNGGGDRNRNGHHIGNRPPEQKIYGGQYRSRVEHDRISHPPIRNDHSGDKYDWKQKSEDWRGDQDD